MELHNNEMNKFFKAVLNSLYGKCLKTGCEFNMEICKNELNKINRRTFIDECLYILHDMCNSFNYTYYKYKTCGLYADLCKCSSLILNIKQVLRVLKANKVEFELTAENGMFITIKLKDKNSPKIVHVVTLERG